MISRRNSIYVIFWLQNISKGANINAKDVVENYVIHFAAIGSLQNNIKVRNDKRPLHFACQNGHLPIIEYLISKGANINATDEYWKKTPLHYASGRGKSFTKTGIVKYLISKRAKKKNKDKDGKIKQHNLAEKPH